MGMLAKLTAALPLAALLAGLAWHSAGAQPPPAPQTGEAGFAAACSACHQLNGKGIPGAFPALAGNSFAQGPQEPVVQTVLGGRGGMPAFRNDLSDEQLASILTYVRSAWGNTASAVPKEIVTKLRGDAGSSEDAAAALQAH
jgi:cytochrome c6